jgi:hypothetical protein
MKELLAQLESVPTEKPRMTVEVVFRDPPWS